IFLIPNRFPIPSQSLQQFAIRLDHFIQSTDIGDHFSSALNDARNVFLNVTAQPLPPRPASAERREIIEVRVLSSELQEFLMIVNILLGAASKKKKEAPILMARWIGQEPVQHRTKRRNTCSGCNEDGVAQRRTKNKISERPLTANVLALFHVAQKVRHETVMYSIETEGEMVIVRRR